MFRDGIPALLIAVLMLTGCASDRVERSEAVELAETALVGMPVSTLLRCAGRPERTRTQADLTFLSYSAGFLAEPLGQPSGREGGIAGGRRPYGTGGDLPVSTHVRSDYCEATFVIEDDRVIDVNYTATAGLGGRRYAVCYPIIQNCLAVVQQRVPVPSPESDAEVEQQLAPEGEPAQ